MTRLSNQCFRLLLGMAVAVVALSPNAAHAFTIPKGVYSVAELETARKEAYKEKKPLLLLYTFPSFEPS